MNPIKEIDLNFGKLNVYADNITAIEIQEGVDIGKEDVIKVIQCAEENTSGDYALISNRKSRYSTDVTKLYMILSSRERLKCAAIVAYRDFTKQMYAQEKLIEEIVSKGQLPLELFEKLDDAVEWARLTLQKKID